MARTPLLLGGAVAMFLLGGVARADDPEADQLREQLRATVLQLRQLQDQQASPPPVAAPVSDQTAKKLAATEAQLRAARRTAAQAQADLDKAMADAAALTATVTADAAQIDTYKTALASASDLGRTLTIERDGLKAQLGRMTAIATACQVKNDHLTAFGESMLTAMHKLTWSDAWGSREPLLGLKRVELENIAQEREDTLRDNHCDPRFDAAPPPKRSGG